MHPDQPTSAEQRLSSIQHEDDLRGMLPYEILAEIRRLEDLCRARGRSRDDALDAAMAAEQRAAEWRAQALASGEGVLVDAAALAVRERARADALAAALAECRELLICSALHVEPDLCWCVEPIDSGSGHSRPCRRIRAYLAAVPQADEGRGGVNVD